MPSALTKTRQAGQGSAAHGGCCASLGHKFGFGNTIDQTLLKVLGCKERGHKSQGPLVHATGKGWVKEHKGQYPRFIRCRCTPCTDTVVGAQRPHPLPRCVSECYTFSAPYT